jgi:integrase
MSPLVPPGPGDKLQDVGQGDSWSRDEVAGLLAVAKDEEPAFYPLLFLLPSIGCRKGEALGLEWADVEISEKQVRIRRSLIRGFLGTPKSGKARSVAAASALSDVLLELLERRRRATFWKT